MPQTLVFRAKSYEAFVVVLSGEAGGPLVTIDGAGHIHVSGGDDTKFGGAAREATARLAKGLHELAGLLSSNR